MSFANGRLDRLTAALASFLRGYHFFKLGAWTIFLATFPLLCLLRGHPGFAVLLAAGGLALDLSIYRPFASREGLRRGLFGGMVALHVLMILVGAYAMTRPITGNWRPLPGTEKGSDAVLASGGEGRLFVLRDVGGERGHVALWSEAEGAFSSLSYEGAWGWGMAASPLGKTLWVLPRGDHDPVGQLTLEGGHWSSRRRPAGYGEHVAALEGAAFAVLAARLYRAVEPAYQFRPVEGVQGRVRDVAAAPGGRGGQVVTVGSGRVYASDDGGASFREVALPGASDTLQPEVALGGGVIYVYEGSFFLNGSLWVSEAGGPLEPRSLPASDTRIIVVNPDDGREAWAGTWGQGVYRTLDAARTWASMGLERTEVRSMAVDFRGKKAYAASANMTGGGVLTRSVP